jgi:hypothetical protein
MEEVAEMEIYMMTNPSMPLTLACAPTALPLAHVAAPVAAVPAERHAPISAPAGAPVALPTAERAPVSRVHQVQFQAELAGVLLLSDGINGTTGNSTTGFKGSDVSTKRYADGGSGVPPRGRPV